MAPLSGFPEGKCKGSLEPQWLRLLWLLGSLHCSPSRQRLGVTQPSRGLSFGQGSEVFSNFASRINKVGRSDLCVTLPLVHWRGHGGLDFIIVTTFCSVRRVLKPVGRTVVGWPSRSLQHVRFQSCSFVSSPGLRLETDQQRYSSRGERPSSSAGEQETIS